MVIEYYDVTETLFSRVIHPLFIYSIVFILIYLVLICRNKYIFPWMDRMLIEAELSKLLNLGSCNQHISSMVQFKQALR